MIPFPFNENRFSFFVADHLLVCQLCSNPKSDRSLLSCLKVTQCLTSEIGDAPMYNSCPLPIQVMTTGPLPAPSKMQIRTVQRLRAQLNPSDNPWGEGKAEDTARKTWTKEFIEKVQAIIAETPQRPIRQIARNLGVSHTTVNACVKEDLNCRSYRRQTSQILTEKTKNLRLIKSVRLLTWTRWTTLFGHTSRTSPTWPPTTPKLALSPPSAEYSPSSPYIIKLPELIFSIKVLK